MNKSDLIDYTAAKTGSNKTDATDAVNAVMSGMAQGIAAGKLELQGFGNFTIKHRAARTGRNPKTGEALEIAAKNVVDFSPSSKLKAAVNPDANPDASA